MDEKFPHLLLPNFLPVLAKKDSSLEQAVQEAVEISQTTGMPIKLNFNGFIFSVLHSRTVQQNYDIILKQLLVQQELALPFNLVAIKSDEMIVKKTEEK